MAGQWLSFLNTSIGMAVIHTMSCAETYGTDHAGLWVLPASAIANGSRLAITDCSLQDGSGMLLA